MSTGDQDRLAAYAAQVSHDLKNPLAGIRLALELAREELGESADPAVLELLARAERSTVRIGQLLDELTATAHGDEL